MSRKDPPNFSTRWGENKQQRKLDNAHRHFFLRPRSNEKLILPLHHVVECGEVIRDQRRDIAHLNCRRLAAVLRLNEAAHRQKEIMLQAFFLIFKEATVFSFIGFNFFHLFLFVVSFTTFLSYFIFIFCQGYRCFFTFCQY